jgi:hypothetical protein
LVDVDAEASRAAKPPVVVKVFVGDVLPPGPITEIVIEPDPPLGPPGGGKTVNDPVADGE